MTDWAINRFGQHVRMPYADYELEWLKAANTLLKPERSAALQDIAEMSGRCLYAVRDKADKIRADERAAARAVLSNISYPRTIMVPGPAKCGRPRLEPSSISSPTRRQLMAGR